MKNKYFLILLFLSPNLTWAQDFFSIPSDSTWSNWDKRFERAFKGINPPAIPGKIMGIVIPSHNRMDILPLTALGYETLATQRFSTVVILMPPPQQYKLDGLALPNMDALESSLGRFNMDTYLSSQIQKLDLNVTIDNQSFYPTVPPLLETQLAALKFVLKGKSSQLKILPIYVKFSDLNSQVKDYAPMLAELIKDLVMEDDIVFVVTGNLTQTSSHKKLVQADGRWLNSIKNLDLETIIEIQLIPDSSGEFYIQPDINVLAMGVLTLQWLGADHGKILAYADSSQLVLTKDKNIPQGYVSAAFVSGMRTPPKIEHIDREKIVEIFDEVFRTDILTLTRQTVASILDPTAAKPPNLVHRQAKKKWPVYVSLYDPEGNLRGQAGSHEAVGPLQESLRQFTYDAVQKAKRFITKENSANYIVDVSIPYGFSSVSQADDLVPLLHGVVVHHRQKNSAVHPDLWRTYGEAHQLLGLICHILNLDPWAYATNKARVESFRILSFNEKEPFQDLGTSDKKKKGKKKKEDDLILEDDFGGDSILPF